MRKEEIEKALRDLESNVKKGLITREEFKKETNALKRKLDEL
jgi:hypothetical protein